MANGPTLTGEEIKMRERLIEMAHNSYEPAEVVVERANSYLKFVRAAAQPRWNDD